MTWHSRTFMAVAGLVVLLASLGIYYCVPRPYGDAVPVDIPGAVELYFGVNRMAMTRFVVLNPCPSTTDGRQDVAQADDDGLQAQPAPVCHDGGTQNAAIEGTAVLRHFDLAACIDLATTRPANMRLQGQFPAQQIGVTATRVGRAIMRSISANPSGRETVSAGTYCGQVLGQRASLNNSLVWTVVARMRDRNSPVSLLFALFCLTASGFFGLLVRTTNSDIPRLVPLWRCYPGLARWYRTYRANHPAGIAAELAEIHETTRTCDGEAAVRLPGRLEARRQALDGSAHVQSLTTAGLDGIRGGADRLAGAGLGGGSGYGPRWVSWVRALVNVGTGPVVGLPSQLLRAVRA